MLSHKLEPIRHAAQLGKRGSLHLSHQATAMDLHSRFSDADVASDLLAEAALSDMEHDLALAWGQRFETLS